MQSPTNASPVFFVDKTLTDASGRKYPASGHYVRPLTDTGRVQGPFASRERAEDFAAGRALDLKVA